MDAAGHQVVVFGERPTADGAVAAVVDDRLSELAPPSRAASTAWHSLIPSWPRRGGRIASRLRLSFRGHFSCLPLCEFALLFLAKPLDFGLHVDARPDDRSVGEHEVASR